MSTPAAPVWLVPKQPGMLSNRLGSNTGADSLGFQTHQVEPDVGLMGAIRAFVYRTKVQGVQQGAQLAWDSGWTGPINVGQLPSNLAAYDKSNVTAIYNGRVYAYGAPTQFAQHASGTQQGVYPVMSAPAYGAGFGSWRYETPAIDNQGNVIFANSMTLLNGRLYITGTTSTPYSFQGITNTGNLDHVYYTTINPDGSLGNWIDAGVITSAGPAKGYAIISNTDGATYANLTVFCPDGTGFPTLNALSYYAPVSLIDGSVGSWTSTGTNNGGFTGSAIIYDTSSAANPAYTVFVIGGDDGAAVKNTVYYNTVNPKTGSLGAWTASTNTLTTAVTRPGAALINQAGINRVFIFGGSTAVGTSSCITNVYYTTTTNLTSNVAWTAGTALPNARASLCGFALPEQHSNATVGTGTWFFGWAGAALNTTATSVAMTIDSGTTHQNQATGQGLSAGDLGTGGVLTTNSDGTQDVTWLYNAFGQAAALSAWLNGDQAQVSFRFVDFQSGDASPATTTVVNFGQPPSIASASLGLTSTAEPTASFKYQQGTGGGNQATWRLAVTDPNSVTVYDTGVRMDTTDKVQWLIAPTPAASTTYTGTFTVTSTDTPMNTIAGVAAQSATATTTATWSHALSAPSTPTGVTAVANNAAGSIAVSWVVPASTSYFRLYYRRSLANTWQLLQDNIAALGAGATQSVTLMDEIAFNVSYDFAVTALSSAYAESALSMPALSGPAFEGAAVNPTLLDSRTIVQSNDFETAPATVDYGHSIGTEALGTLAAWTAFGGVGGGIASNVVTITAANKGTGDYTGHPDTGDCTFTVRAQFATGGIPWIFIHTDGSNTNLVGMTMQSTGINLWKTVASTQTSVAGAATTLTAGTWYWMRIQASGTTYTATVYADNAGAISTQIATCSATIADAAVQYGRFAIYSDGTSTGNVLFGGAFSNVCYATGPAPTGWSTYPNISAGSINWATAQEPWFCWSNKQAYYGTHSLSIWFPLSTGTSKSGWLPPGVLLANGVTYQVNCYTRASASASGGFYISSQQVGSLAANTGSSFVATGGSYVGIGITNFGQPTGYATATGTVYFDYATIIQPATPTGVLFRSFGTDATGTLNAWPQQQAPTATIGSNQVTLGNGTIISAGHVDWGDVTPFVRFQISTSGTTFGLIARFISLSPVTLARGEFTGTGITLTKYISGAATTVATTACTITAGSWYFGKIAVSGTTYTVTLYQDAAGFVGDQVATCSGTIADASVQNGPLGLQSFAGGQTLVGGPYSNVCIVQGATPTGQTPVATWTSSEPAFCWDKTVKHDGSYSGSIFIPSAQSGWVGTWQNAAVTVPAGVYEPAGYVELKAGSTGAATIDFNGSGTTASPAADGTFHQVSGTTANQNAGSYSLNCKLTGGGTAYFDLTSLAGAQATIAPTAYTSMLHIAGKGTTYSVPLIVSGSPVISRKLDVKSEGVFGQSAPVARYGILDYATVDLTNLILANVVTTLDQFLNLKAQAELGNLLYFRDALGTMLTVALGPDVKAEYLSSIYRRLVPKLVQAPNPYSPSIAAPATALGFRQLVNGSVVPLDISEQAA